MSADLIGMYEPIFNRTRISLGSRSQSSRIFQSRFKASKLLTTATLNGKCLVKSKGSAISFVSLNALFLADIVMRVPRGFKIRTTKKSQFHSVVF